jgi:SAM-dependent methyltransferase
MSTFTHPVLLVVGGGAIGSGIDALYSDPGLDIVAFDIYGTPAVQLIADGHQIPLRSGSVDAVVVQAVLEHVLEPAVVVSEIHRVLKKDGIVYAETPFMQPVHAGPYDFTRFTESGHRYLFKRFDRIDSGVVLGPGASLLWNLEYAARGLFRSRAIGKVVKAAFFWLQYLDRFVPEGHSIDTASGVYFLGRKSDHEIPPHGMVEYYRGAEPQGRS